MQQRKTDIVHTLTQGIRSLFKKNNIAAYGGTARFISRDQIDVCDTNGALVETLSGAHIIIATGSTPITLEAVPVDNEWIFDSEGALSFTSVPRRLGIIGAGAIGLELGSVWSRLGSQVVILEAMEIFLSAADRDIAREALRLYHHQGLDIRLGCKVVKVEIKAPGSLCASYRHQGKTAIEQLEMDRLIVAVGRRAYTDGLALEQVGIQTDDHGHIEVDTQWRTSAEGIYALGDVIHGPMLAHKASEEGVAVAELIGGDQRAIDHRAVPWIIYTQPEIAWVGETEERLSARGVNYRIGKFPFSANGRAHSAGISQGFVKIIAEAQTDEILGVHIIGAQGSEMIAEGITSMMYFGSSEDLARTIHAHPTLGEAMHEAALALDRRSLHS